MQTPDGPDVLSSVGPEVIVVLVAIAFVGGIGISTIGPGGIFLTIALYTLTPMTSAEVAGTAHVTFIATGIVGTVAYRSSGELSSSEDRRLALALGVSSMVGALIGSQLNLYVDRRTFGVLLGLASAVTGLVLIRRQVRALQPVVTLDLSSRHSLFVLGMVGLTVGMAAGLVGVGGPVLAVPALVLLGVPLLVGVAVAQVQSLFISGFATIGYLVHGAVDPWVAILVGVPQVFGVVLGWYIAHRIQPSRLTAVLGIVLVAIGSYLIIPLP